MNENSGATPNPLNPNPIGQTPPANQAPQMGGAQPMASRPRMAPRPIQSVGARRPMNINQAPAETASMDGAYGAGASTGNTPADAEASMNTMIQSLDPTGRPMEQAPVFVDKPKKKTGLIVAIATFAVLLIGGGVAAAIILLTGGGDAVSKAMNRIMAGNTPANVAIDGTIELRSNDDNSPVESIKFDLDSNLVRNSMVNTSSATVTLSIKDMDDISFEFDEVYADNGELYLKLDGVSEALQNPGLLTMLNGGTLNTVNQPALNSEPVDCAADGDTTDCAAPVEGAEVTAESPEIVAEGTEVTTEIAEPATNCVTDGTGMTNCTPTTTGSFDNSMLESLSAVLGIVDGIDGQWLRISSEEMGMVTSGGALPSSNVSCITGLVSDLNTGSTSAAEAYDKNPFVKSTTEGLTISKKNNPLYKLSVDSTKFADFVNSMDNSGLANDVYACLGLQNNASMTAADVQKIVDSFPTIYAEVNSDNNFTRLYLEGDSEEANMTILIDLSFTYPDSVNVNAPNDYQDFSTVLQTMFSGMYSDTTVNGGTIEGSTEVFEGGEINDGGEVVEGEEVINTVEPVTQ